MEVRLGAESQYMSNLNKGLISNGDAAGNGDFFVLLQTARPHAGCWCRVAIERLG